MALQVKVAYFCMEYGLHEELKTYAGGLGVLAGDVLKAAADTGYPLIGVGLMWRQGYTTQLIDESGHPYDTYPDYRYDFLQDTGVQVHVPIRGRDVACQVWLVDRYGNAPLYLLDTDLDRNTYEDRVITAQLYGGTSEDRVAQEIVLGIGGVRALRALGIRPAVYHFNEGHAVLAGIELIREKMAAGQDFAAAVAATRREIVFTTHTPVPEGNESHHHGLLEYLGAYDGLGRSQMEELGGNPFNMTVAALRLSRHANGVSELHGHTSRAMWKDVSGAAPIIHVTNGVHAATWQDPRVAAAFAAGTDLWEPHMAAKRELCLEVEARTGTWLDPQVLTVGFARRAAPYKRSDLVLRDLNRLGPLLQAGRIQLLFSGKAHPRDDAAKGTIAHLVNMSRRFPGRIVFLSNYDMRMGRLLTRGCDVWLNNPRRPMEASGTSGMKAAMNGVLNCSILDGWWPEACRHGINGWQISDAYVGPDQDGHDLRELMKVLLGEVVPTYYHDRARWIRMMRESIAATGQAFSAQRMLRQYVELMYEAPADV